MQQEYGIIRPAASLAAGGMEDMAVRRKANKKWEASVPTGERYTNGRIKYERRETDTKKEAEKIEEKLLAKYQQKTQEVIQSEINKLLKVQQPKSISFIDAAEEWFNVKKLEVRKNTLDGYRIIMDAHLIPHFKRFNIKDIEEKHVRAYVAEKMEKLSSTTLKHHYSVLSMILKFKNNHCMKNIRRPQDSGFEPEPITDVEELEKFIIGLEGTAAYLASKISAMTGMRMSEIAGLQWIDVDFQEETFFIRRSLHWAKNDDGKWDYFIENTKTRLSRRKISVPPKLIEELAGIKKNREEQGIDGVYVCIDSNHNPICKDNIYHSFKRRARKLGYENLRFHDLRHSFATIAIAQGVDPRTVQEHMGHATMELTLGIYTTISNEQDRDLANRFDF